MNNFIKYLGLFFCANVFAQSGEISLEWDEKKVAISDSGSFLIPSVNNSGFNYKSDRKVIEVANVLSEKQLIDPKSIKISNVKSVRLNKKYADIDINNIPSDFSCHLSAGSSPEGNKNILYYEPLFKKGKEIYKVVSFTYEYQLQRKGLNTTKSLNTTSSVLANGSWHKIKINETGVYKIDKNFMNQLGIPSSVDPRTIRIYSHGGKNLPLANNENFDFDLPEIAIQVIGQNDGVFDADDFILFYAEGTKKWNPENASHLNPYSDDSYYYITYNGNLGKRISNFNQATGTVEQFFTNSEERVFHEQDLVNVANLSRKWFGESFSTSFTNTFTLNLENIDTSLAAKLSGNFASESSRVSSMNVYLNNQQIGNHSVPGSTINSKAAERYFEYTITNPSVANQIMFQFNNQGVPTAKSYIDFVAIDYYKRLQGYGKQFLFRNSGLNTIANVGEFVISNASNITQVWDVTDHKNVKSIENNSSQFRLRVQGGSAKEFLALDLNDTYQPTIIGNVANQNLKGTIFNDGPVDYLIITHPDLFSAANRLANFHKTTNGLNTKVVSLATIYEEFSSGKQDISAIRNFVRYVYHNSPSSTRKLKYVNLFGETSSDYRNRTQNRSNIVPIFQSVNTTLNPNVVLYENMSDHASFCTDDFFGLLDENEGHIVDQMYTGIDVAVGRMLAQNLQEANVLVDKVISYQTKDNTSRWKLNTIALADDVDVLSDYNLQATLNNMSDKLTDIKPYFNVRKILLDSYNQEVSSGGPRYSKAKKEFYDALDAGALVVNFLGHGGENGLTSERMMDMSDIDQMNNASKLPLFIITTCEFTRFDNPSFLSGGERLAKKSDGGAIGLVATSRKIQISNAERFADVFNDHLFNLNLNIDENATIAERLRLAKNTGLNEKGVVSYIGDPALKLAIPKPEIVITKVNDVNVNDFTGHLRALDMVKLEGQIQNENGSLVSGFNGEVAIQIFDKNINRSTLGNDGVQINNQLYTIDFETLGEIVFKGNASVENGVFQIEFLIPKDIKLNIGEGKVSLYAVKNTQNVDDYLGANTSIKFGGINNNAAEDNKSPEIKLYMNDESFIYGGVTNNSPLFLAILEDENGINTASGIGHDMIAILDGDENNPFVVNEYFETELNNFRKGFVKYPFKDLKPGVHNVVFKAWDSYNNMGTAEIQFVVSDNQSITLNNVLNYPNPFIDYTEFWFEHNRPAEPLQVQVQILSVTGRIVKTINQVIVSEGFNSRDIHWDGKDDFGNKLAKGVYIYTLKVKSTLTGEQVDKIEKLVIL